MKKSYYKGWKIYSVRSGSNLGMRSLKAKHPLRVARLECNVDALRGLTQSIATSHIKRDIDAIEISHPL